MTDKKLNDNKTFNPCDECQHSFSKNNQESNVCKICEFKQSQDLINRQKAEKEALIAGQETLQKYIAKQNAEIERLRKTQNPRRCDFCEHRDKKAYEEPCDLCKGYDLYEPSNVVQRIKAEAVKEFANRLKKEFSQCQREYRTVLNSDGACAMVIAKRVTDNLLKEMLGKFSSEQKPNWKESMMRTFLGGRSDG